ncbi:MAG TPA: hypothetical protein VGI39_00625 [Polyangiaceae bacterium]
MSYLYGDSTPSPLESNFLQFLGEALDFSVHVLLSAERLKHFAAQIAKLRGDADAEIARIEGLNRGVSAAVQGSPKGAAESPTAACASAILLSVGEIVDKNVAKVRAALDADISAIGAQDVAEREGCLRALEGLVRGHELPDAKTTLHLVREGGGYAATRTTQTPFALDYVMGLDISPPHAFSQVTRVDRLMAQLEIHAPESSGWLRKEMKTRPQRLEKYYLTEMLFAPGATTLRLRATLDSRAQGFDLEVCDGAPRVQALRVGDSGETPEPIEVSEADAAKVVALEEKLRTLALEVGQNGALLREAKLDQISFLDLPDPAVLVDRLVGAMVPVVQEIARHSLAPTELVLKRLLGEHRREEIFVSKATLADKLAPLPDVLRSKFRALDLTARVSREPAEPIERAPSSAPRPVGDAELEAVPEMVGEVRVRA